MQNENKLNLGMEAQDLLDKLCINKLFPEQEQTIQAISNQNDCLLVSPTSSGKSLPYILCSQQRLGVVVVISPLLAMINVQISKLNAIGIKAVSINSGQTNEENKKSQLQIESQSSQLLFIAPERLQNQNFSKWLTSLKVQLIVIDEAHCVSHWGYGFRPEYKNLGLYLKSFNSIPKLALTATATRHTIKDIIWHLGLHNPKTIVKNPIKDSTEINTLKTNSVDDQSQQLIQIIANHNNQQGIIFTATKKHCEELARTLKIKTKLKIEFYHSDINTERKLQLHNSLAQKNLDLLIATKAFSLGVDFPSVSYVIHNCLPDSLESYVQEIGRAGRAGQKIHSYIVYTSRDLAIRKFMLEQSHPDFELVNLVAHQILKHCNPISNYETFVSAILNELSKLKPKKLDSVISLFLREKMLSIWTADFEKVVQLDCEDTTIVDFIKEYEARRKIVFSLYDYVLEFLHVENKLLFLKNYFN